MVVLVAISAAVYVAILLPFKMFPLIPGITELRPATAIPPLASFLFGPAAAWGMALGNLIGDFAGTFGPASAFGFLGNFLLGWVPYRMWRAMSREPLPSIFGARAAGAGSSFRWTELAEYAFIVVVASAACALVIGWGGGLLLGLFPPRVVAPVILANNVAWGLLATPLLARAVAPRVRSWGLTADQLLPAEEPSGPSPARLVGLFLTPAASLGGFLLLYFLTGSPAAATGLDARWLLAIPSALVFVGTALL